MAKFTVINASMVDFTATTLALEVSHNTVFTDMGTEGGPVHVYV